MHVNVKAFLVLITGCIVSTAHAELVWEQTQIELRPALGENTAVAHFKYQNKGDKPIAIKSVNSTCGCTAATAKQSAAPGEKGEVTATFKIGDRTGVQQKAITVATDDSAHPSTILTLKVAIPTFVELQPTLVYWQAGETPRPKTILAKAGPGVSVKSIDVSSSDPNFAAKVEPGPAANEFRINIEPRQTTQMAAATFTIKPVLEKGPAKVLYASARVMPQRPATAQPSGAPALPPANQPGQTSAATNAAPAKSMIDACALLTGKEIESIQGEPSKDTRASGNLVGGLAISQCYFMLPTSANSISLTVTQKGGGPDLRDPKEQWKEMFHREKVEKKESEEGEKKIEPEKIAGLGDEAFWMGTRVGGELYALKGDSYIRISVGGAGDPSTKLNKTKALAEMVLKRL